MDFGEELAVDLQMKSLNFDGSVNMSGGCLLTRFSASCSASFNTLEIVLSLAEKPASRVASGWNTEWGNLFSPVRCGNFNSDLLTIQKVRLKFNCFASPGADRGENDVFSSYHFHPT